MSDSSGTWSIKVSTLKVRPHSGSASKATFNAYELAISSVAFETARMNTSGFFI